MCCHMMKAMVGIFVIVNFMVRSGSGIMTHEQEVHIYIDNSMLGQAAFFIFYLSFPYLSTLSA